MGTAKVKNQIKLMPVKELLGKNFNIPSYQRGYKWTKKQAEDLLNDLDEFKTSVDNKSNQDSFYCLQPLAVAPKRREVGEGFEINKYKTEQDAIIAVKKLFNKRVTWDVIDGQQRLTTIYLLLCYLGEKNLYNISYETRENSEKFLSKFLKNENDINTEASKNVDYWHIYEVYNTIKNWFEGKEDEYKLSFKRIILEETQFIWYETSEEPIKVFTRLNIGKIRLTNSELIKSMVMSHTKDVVQQYKIAGEWDMIEQQLQNDEFWYFVHSAQYDKPTRIDFLFDALCEYDIQKRIKNNNKKNKNKNAITTYIGTDQYKTFRYYDYLLKNNGIGLYNGDVCHEIWEKIKSLFYVINEWYNDVEFYHYIGYLLCHEKININKIYQEWQNVGKKQLFKGYLKGEIKEILKSCCKQKNVAILEQQYEIDIELKEDKKQSIPKTVCRPILLLHNIQTVINQSKSATDNDEFKHFIFNRFPFHLYKTENWDVEHIDSNTTNDLKDDFSKLIWMLQFYDKMNISQANGDKPTTYKTIYYGIIEKLQNKPSASESEIKDIIKKNKDIFKDFEELEQEIESSISEQTTNKQLSYEQKNQIGNFTLLDASTNRGYGNSIFPKKRLTIMAKDRCQKYQLKFTNEGFVSELVPAPENSTFIPPVTRNVFMKYYTPETSDFTTWNTDDFNAYIGDIEKVLEEFLTDEQSTK